MPKDNGKIVGPHLWVALSPHGFGHAAMTAPVINALRREIPDLRLTIQTTIARSWLAGRYEGDFDLVDSIPDFGLSMVSPLEVDSDTSFHKYKDLHDNIDELVELEAARLSAAAPDLLLANIPYVSLLAAKRAGVPAIAFSCLNWADLFRAYCAGRPGAAGIEETMLDGYRSAQTFLRPAPSLPMERLGNTQKIGPIARRGYRRPDHLRDLLDDLFDGDGAYRVGLIAFGGMDLPLPFDRWPRLPGWRWIVSGNPCGHPDMVSRDAVPMEFTDLLRSCDLIVGKPGYGTFSEAGVNGVPMLYLPRYGWPESPYLTDWLAQNGRCLPVTPGQLFDGESLEVQLRKLFSFPLRPLVEPTGADEAIAAILPYLQPVESRRM